MELPLLILTTVVVLWLMGILQSVEVRLVLLPHLGYGGSSGGRAQIGVHTVKYGDASLALT